MVHVSQALYLHVWPVNKSQTLIHLSFIIRALDEVLEFQTSRSIEEQYRRCNPRASAAIGCRVYFSSNVSYSHKANICAV